MRNLVGNEKTVSKYNDNAFSNLTNLLTKSDFCLTRQNSKLKVMTPLMIN